MINRRVTRTILNTTEITHLLTPPNGADYVIPLQTTDSLYIGYHGRFASRFIQVSIPNAVASLMTVEYWNGTSWEDVDDFLDQTASGGKTLAQSGFISWQNKADWAARNLTGIDADVSLFWIKVTVSANLTGTTAIKSVIDLYCDDNLLRAYFPEIITDTNYLPDGKTNFIEQYIAAKELVVLRLKQRKKIETDAQIIDPNDVAVAATYAAACLIMRPIATSDHAKAIAAVACNGFEDEIGKVTIPTDDNMDGIISDDERMQSFAVKVERR